MNRVPFFYQLMGLFVVAFIPALWILGSFWSQRSQFKELQEELAVAWNNRLLYEKREGVNRDLRNQHQGENSSFLQQLRQLNLLEGEKEALAKRTQEKELSQELKRREDFLRGNHLRPTEKVQSRNSFWETKEIFLPSVEVNVQDLENILNIIEGKNDQVKRPQIFFTEFSLERKSPRMGLEVYALSGKLEQRDYLK